MSKDNFKTIAVGILFAMFLCFSCIFNVISQHTDYIECGMCGAHVHDWWKIRNMSDTEFVNVCEYCYLDAMED